MLNIQISLQKVESKGNKATDTLKLFTGIYKV
jgi:hypothetical protein